MTAHIAFPAVDNEQVPSLKDGSLVPIPATLSKKVLTGMLREQLGYKGIIISDAFTMEAIAEHFGRDQAVVRAVQAGVDIILMPQDIAAAHGALVQAVRTGSVSATTIHASVKRILELKSKYGLFDPPTSLTTKLAALGGIIGSEPHRAVEREIAQRAVTLLASRDGGVHPDLLRLSDHVVIAAVNAEQAEQLKKQLAQAGASLALNVDTVIVGQGQGSASSVQARLEQADYVIVASYQFRNVASLFNWSDTQSIIDFLNSHNKRYSLLSLGNPYELMFVSGVHSALAVYGKQEPNTAAAIQALLGQLEPRGVLPVDIALTTQAVSP